MFLYIKSCSFQCCALLTMQAVKDWRTNLAGDELMPSSSHINFVRIVSQVENIGSEAGIMSYFFRLNGLKCQEWKPRHLCDWNTPWWAMCIAQPAEICSMQSWSVGPNLLFKFIRVIMYSLYLYCIHSVAQILFFFWWNSYSLVYIIYFYPWVNS